MVSLSLKTEKTKTLPKGGRRDYISMVTINLVRRAYRLQHKLLARTRKV